MKVSRVLIKVKLQNDPPILFVMTVYKHFKPFDDGFSGVTTGQFEQLFTLSI